MDRGNQTDREQQVIIDGVEFGEAHDGYPNKGSCKGCCFISQKFLCDNPAEIAKHECRTRHVIFLAQSDEARAYLVALKLTGKV
jgi:hypothetical protein